MKAYCAGNGQLHQMSMGGVTNTLDCMHDQQIVVGEGDRWKYTRRSPARYAQTLIPEAIRARMHSMTCFLSSRILRGGIAYTLTANYWKGTGTRNGREREYVLIIYGA